MENFRKPLFNRNQSNNSILNRYAKQISTLFFKTKKATLSHGFNSLKFVCIWDLHSHRYTNSYLQQAGRHFGLWRWRSQRYRKK